MNFMIFTKSYRGDFEQLEVLAESVESFNKDNIPFYVSVPNQDFQLAKDVLNGVGMVVADEEILEGAESDVGHGWFTQQIVKSNAWKVIDCENYFSVDSDGFFIRDFYLNDFMYVNDTPYTVCHQQKELFSWTVHNANVLGFDPKSSFVKDKKNVMHVFNRGGSVYYDFGPNPVIWSVKVWKTFQDILALNDMTFVDALQICPSEFTWYGETLFSTKVIDLMPIEPIFKVFHYMQQYLDYKNRGISQEHIAQNYLGIVLQSSFPQKHLRY